MSECPCGMTHSVCSWKWPLTQGAIAGADCLGGNKGLQDLHTLPDFEIGNSKRDTIIVMTRGENT